ncbi:MAG: hypothetical protein WD270_10165, partial [Acetobacterales bacterium]
KAGGRRPPPRPPPRGGGGAPGGGAGLPAVARQPRAEAQAVAASPASFPVAVELFREHREGRLFAELVNNVRLVHFEPGRIELLVDEQALKSLTNRVGELLSQWTGRRWMVVSVTARADTAAEPTLADQRVAADARRKEEAAAHPAVQRILEAFPDAVIQAVRDGAPEVGETQS